MPYAAPPRCATALRCAKLLPAVSHMPCCALLVTNVLRPFPCCVTHSVFRSRLCHTMAAAGSHQPSRELSDASLDLLSQVISPDRHKMAVWQTDPCSRTYTQGNRLKASLLVVGMPCQFPSLVSQALRVRGLLCQPAQAIHTHRATSQMPACSCARHCCPNLADRATNGGFIRNHSSRR
jgi:hypothetical protein